MAEPNTFLADSSDPMADSNIPKTDHDTLNTTLTFTNTEELADLIPAFILTTLSIVFITAIITNLFRRPKAIIPEDRTPTENKLDRRTRHNTAKNRRTKHTVINHFAANAINIYNEEASDRDGLASIRGLADITTLASARSQQRRVSRDSLRRTTSTARANFEMNSSPPRGRSRDAELPTDFATITFRTTDRPTHSIVKTFPLDSLVGELFEWAQRSPCPFPQEKEGVEFSLVCEEMCEARDLGNVKCWTVGQADLDGRVVLVES